MPSRNEATRERKEEHTDQKKRKRKKRSITKAITEKVRRYENTVKMEHHPLASPGLTLPLTALERQGIKPDSNQALSLYTVKIWPGIPLSPAIEM